MNLLTLPRVCHWNLAIAVLPSLALLLTGCSPSSSSSSTGAQTDSRSSTNPAAPAVAEGAATPEFTRLQGKWLRPDGGYILEFKRFDAQGVAEAGYSNPNPINVSKARAIQEGSTTKVFVELRDVNYPGCTYSLTYDLKTDQLYGQYFQAAIQQTYDVAFERVRD